MNLALSFFRDPALYHQAMIHRSYCNEHPGIKSNERLEFLGDSVLSLIISDRLFRLFPDIPEGRLTSRRSYLVQTGTLAEKAISLGFDKEILLSRGEEESGGRANHSLLANTFEAVLGALFIDSGIDQCYRYLEHVFPDHELLQDVETKDPKSMLQEKAQAAGLGTPVYHTVSSIGPDHAREFTVSVTVAGKPEAEGVGTSKQRAEVDAARIALKKLFS